MRFQNISDVATWALNRKQKAVWLSHEYYAYDYLVDALSFDEMSGKAISNERAIEQVLTLISKPLCNEDKRRIYRYALENMPVYSIDQLRYIAKYHMGKCRYGSASYSAWMNIDYTCKTSLHVTKVNLEALASNRCNGSMHCKLYARFASIIVC